MPEYPEIKQENAPVGADGDSQPNPYLPGYKPYVPPQKEYKALSAKEKIFTAVFFILSFVMVDFAFFHGFHLGFTTAYFLLFAAATVFLWNKEKKPSVFPILCGVISLAGSVTFTLYCNTFINVIMTALIVGLFTLYCLGISCGFSRAQGSFRILFDILLGAVIDPLVNITDVAGAFKKTLKADNKNTSVLKGVLLALPVLVIVIPLLISGDAAFEGLVSSVGENIGVYLLEIALTVPLFFFGYSYMYGKKNSLNVRHPASASAGGKLTASGCVSFLSVISATYLVYLFSQLAYFFSAFNGILPDGYTKGTSMFARRGFYEMFAVCAINVVLISVINLLVKKNGKGGTPMPVKLMSLFISLFSVLLIVIAMVKMKLNIDTYGFTRNRLLVSVFMIMMFIVIAFFIVHIFVPKISYMQPIIIICSVMFVALSFADIDSFTYEYNMKAYKNGTIEEFDAYNVNNLQPPEEYLVKVLKEGAMTGVTELLANEVYYSEDYDVDTYECKLTAEKTDWRAYCYEKEKAKKLVEEYFASLTDEKKETFRKYFNEYEYGYGYEDDMLSR